MFAGRAGVDIFVLIMKIRHNLFVRCRMSVVVQDIGMIVMRKNVGIHPVITGVKRTGRLPGYSHHHELSGWMFYHTVFRSVDIAGGSPETAVYRPGIIDIRTGIFFVTVGAQPVKRMLITLRAEENPDPTPDYFIGIQICMSNTGSIFFNDI